jgi:[ribosomal protein S5]-alanine N-acetyltransferase
MTFPVIKTRRLILRRLVPEDRKTIFLLRSDKQVSMFIDRPITGSETEAAAFIEKIRSNDDLNLAFYWAICLDAEPELIGTICLWNFSADRKRAELGYEMFPAFQGRGLMSEAVNAVLDYGFKDCGLAAVEACTHRDNILSMKLLSKFRFRYLPGKVDADNNNNEVYLLEHLKQ